MSEELEEQNDENLSGSLIVIHNIFQTINVIVKQAGKVLAWGSPFFFSYLIVKELAGKTTMAEINIFFDFFAEIIDLNTFAWGVAGLSVLFALFWMVLYFFARRENTKLIERFGGISAKYELLIDNKRTGSGLREDGKLLEEE